MEGMRAAVTDHNVVDIFSASRTIPSDRELMQVAEIVGMNNWEMLGISLGLTNLEIERLKLEEPAVHARINGMLQRWKKKNGVKATKRELHDKLEQMKIDISLVKSKYSVHRHSRH